MNFADGLTKAYATKWSFINTFDVQFVFINPDIKDQIDWDDEIDGKNLALNVVAIDTPQFTNQPIEQFVANRWIIGNGRDELYRFSMTFRDRDSMSLYRKFVRLYQKTREDYVDNVKFNVLLTKEADWHGQANKLLFQFENTIVENVSQLQFNTTTENQIAEFSVNFKTTFPNLERIKSTVKSAAETSGPF